MGGCSDWSEIRMAGFRKPSTLKELDWVMSTLNAYPLGKQVNIVLAVCSGK